ncbi:MAG: dienelactone hydrolase family protein [Granulosicoccus sp.]
MIDVATKEAPHDIDIEDLEIDSRIYDLYDKYCHGFMSRREFLKKASAITVAGVSGLTMAQALFPRYAQAQTISFTDERIKANYVEYASPGGNSGEMRGYLVQPTSAGPHPAVLVIHENRGLNPYIEDVARRLATQGFLALAPDGLHPAGGYPGNDDDGRAMQKSLDRAKLMIDMLNSAQFVQNHELSTGKLGSVGFCFGGGVVNFLATKMGNDMLAGVPFYGSAPPAEEIANIKGALMIQTAENDDRINAQWPDFETALKANKIEFQRHIYPGTGHGFHNNSTKRYNEEQAKIAWDRTLEFFSSKLA